MGTTRGARKHYFLGLSTFNLKLSTSVPTEDRWKFESFDEVLPKLPNQSEDAEAS